MREAIVVKPPVSYLFPVLCIIGLVTVIKKIRSLF